MGVGFHAREARGPFVGHHLHEVPVGLHRQDPMLQSELSSIRASSATRSGMPTPVSTSAVVTALSVMLQIAGADTETYSDVDCLPECQAGVGVDAVQVGPQARPRSRRCHRNLPPPPWYASASPATWVSPWWSTPRIADTRLPSIV